MATGTDNSEPTGTGKPKVKKSKLTPEEIGPRREEHLRRVAGPAKINAGGK